MDDLTTAIRHSRPSGSTVVQPSSRFETGRLESMTWLTSAELGRIADMLQAEIGKRNPTS